MMAIDNWYKELEEENESLVEGKNQNIQIPKVMHHQKRL